MKKTYKEINIVGEPVLVTAMVEKLKEMGLKSIPITKGDGTGIGVYDDGSFHHCNKNSVTHVGTRYTLPADWHTVIDLLSSPEIQKEPITSINDFTVRVHTMEDRGLQEFEYEELKGISIGCEDSEQFYSKGALLLLQKICSKYGKVSVDLHGETFELDEVLIENLLEMLND